MTNAIFASPGQLSTPHGPGTRPSPPMPVARAELLEWHDAQAAKPDAELLQLIWWSDEAGHCDWDAAWWSGEEWLLAESGGPVPGEVLFYARPEGPDQ